MMRPMVIAVGLACVLSTALSAFAEKEKELFKTKATMAAFTPDGQFLIAAGNNNVRIIDLAAKKAHVIVKSYQPIVLAPDGKTLAAEDLSAADTRTITLYDVPSGKPKGDPFPCPGDGVIADALTPDGKTFIHGGLKDLFLIDTSSGKVAHTFKNLGGQPFSVAVSPDGKYLACGTDSDGKKVWVWDLATLGSRCGPSPGCPASFRRSPSPPTASSWPPLPMRSSRCGASTTARSSRPSRVRKTRWRRGVAFGSDGKILVTECSDSTVTIWDLDSGKALDAIKTAKEPLGLSLSSDGKMLAVTMDGEQTAAYDLSAIVGK